MYCTVLQYCVYPFILGFRVKDKSPISYKQLMAHLTLTHWLLTKSTCRCVPGLLIKTSSSSSSNSYPVPHWFLCFHVHNPTSVLCVCQFALRPLLVDLTARLLTVSQTAQLSLNCSPELSHKQSMSSGPDERFELRFNCCLLQRLIMIAAKHWHRCCLITRCYANYVC